MNFNLEQYKKYLNAAGRYENNGFLEYLERFNNKYKLLDND